MGNGWKNWLQWMVQTTDPKSRRRYSAYSLSKAHMQMYQFMILFNNSLKMSHVYSCVESSPFILS
jgi:hypothetical protein